MISLFLMAGLLTGSPSSPGSPVDDVGCGQACCYLLLQELGHDVTLDELDSSFGTLANGQSGRVLSLEQMQKALQFHGLVTEGYRLRWSDVESAGWPAILHVAKREDVAGHFVVLTRRDGELVVLDPVLNAPVRVSDPSIRRRLSEAFSGYVLMPANSRSAFVSSQTLALGVALTLLLGTGAVAVFRRRKPAIEST